MQEYVTYRQYGAVGDGKTDDMPAIVRAHEYANTVGMPVRADDGDTYFIGTRDLTATIRTDTDWTGAKFIIYDIDLENRDAPLFKIPAEYTPEPLTISTLYRTDRSIDFTAPDGEYMVALKDEDCKVYRRKGVNRSDGVSKSEKLIIDSRGNILCDRMWDFDHITSATVRRLEDAPLSLRGGYFETVANTCESKYTYHARNIVISRSRVTVSGITHRVVGEGDHGAPYAGFLSVSDAAHVVLRDCSLTGHKIYYTPGYGGVSPMGSYDINIHAAIDISLISITQVPDIMDNTRWGLMGTNFCKDMLLENCAISRFDAHMGVTNGTIRGCRLGWQNVCVIGCGKFVIEDSDIYGGAVVTLRYDYGSHFDGDLIIRHCTWTPRSKNPAVVWSSNIGDHDFGYTCRMPRNVTIDGLAIDDTAVEGLESISVFGIYDDAFAPGKPHAYVVTEHAKLHDIKTLGGTKVKLCLRPEMYDGMQTEWT